MAKTESLKKLIDNIEKIVQNRCHEGYTGSLTITIIFNQGGFRDLKHNEALNLNFKNNSDS